MCMTCKELFLDLLPMSDYGVVLIDASKGRRTPRSRRWSQGLWEQKVQHFIEYSVAVPYLLLGASVSRFTKISHRMSGLFPLNVYPSLWCGWMY